MKMVENHAVTTKKDTPASCCVRDVLLTVAFWELPENGLTLPGRWQKVQELDRIQRVPKLVLRKVKTVDKTLLACMHYCYHLYSCWYSGHWDWYPFYIWQQPKIAVTLLIVHFQTPCADQALLFAGKEKQALIKFMVSRANFSILSVPGVPAFSAMLLDSTHFNLVPFSLGTAGQYCYLWEYVSVVDTVSPEGKLPFSGCSVGTARLLLALMLFWVSPHCTEVYCVVMPRQWYFSILWQSWLLKYSSYK